MYATGASSKARAAQHLAGLGIGRKCTKLGLPGQGWSVGR